MKSITTELERASGPCPLVTCREAPGTAGINTVRDSSCRGHRHGGAGDVREAQGA